MTDEAGNKTTKTITVTVEIKKYAPEITLSQQEVNTFGGMAVTIDGDKLYFGETEVASWSDVETEVCQVTLSLNGKEIKS